MLCACDKQGMHVIGTFTSMSKYSLSSTGGLKKSLLS